MAGRNSDQKVDRLARFVFKWGLILMFALFVLLVLEAKF